MRPSPAGAGSPHAQAALGLLLRRIEANEELPDYDELVEGGRRLREASGRRGRRATKESPIYMTGAA